MNNKVFEEFILPVTLAFLVLFQLSNYTTLPKCISIPPTIEKMKNIEFSTNNKRYKFK